jgi:site-specific recombinase XerD
LKRFPGFKKTVMLLPIKLICGKRVRKDGTNAIYVQYCYRPDKRILLSTEINIPIRYWHKKLLRISNDLPTIYGNHESFNERLGTLIRLSEDLVSFTKKKNIEDSLSFIKKTFRPNLDIASLENIALETKLLEAKNNNKLNLDLYYQIDDYIKSKEKKVCKDMPRIYRNMKEHLKEFEEFRQEPITFDCLDLNFYEEFVDFLTFDYIQRRRKIHVTGLKVNTIGKTVKQFRTFLRNRIRKKIIPLIDMDGWTILEEEVDAVYLSMDEINLIYDLDLSNYPHLTNYRDDFILGCLTGLRFSDFSELVKDDVRKDMLYKKQNKSDHWVVIPLRDEALKILKNRFNNNIGILTNAEFNRHIKTIIKLAGITELIKFSYKKLGRDIIEIKPKYTLVTSHTCRRSFCTNEFLAGTPVELIMKISGHKSVKDFYKYIRITPVEAGQKIKELWVNRGGMSAFNEKKEAAFDIKKIDYLNKGLPRRERILR